MQWRILGAVMLSSSDCILIMGQRNCGKSFLARNLAKMWPRKIIIDPMCDYSEHDGEIYTTFFELSERLKNLKKSNDKSFTLIYQFNPESGVSENEFNEICRLAYYFCNVQLIIEEVHLFSNAHFIPKWLQNMAFIGRHHNTSLMLTTQRPASLHKSLVSQCSHIFCGRMIEGNDMRYVSSFLGQSSERLVSIQERRFLYFSSHGVLEVSNNF